MGYTVPSPSEVKKATMTPELETIFDHIKRLESYQGLENISELMGKLIAHGKIRRIMEHNGYSFFIYPNNSETNWHWTDAEVERALPKGYVLIAWYPTGSNSFLAQTRNIYSYEFRKANR